MFVIVHHTINLASFMPIKQAKGALRLRSGYNLENMCSSAHFGWHNTGRNYELHREITNYIEKLRITKIQGDKIRKLRIKYKKRQISRSNKIL